MPETKEPTIEEHIKRARELTPQQTRVTEPAFEELLKAVEKILELASPIIANVEYLMRNELPENVEISTEPDTGEE